MNPELDTHKLNEYITSEKFDPEDYSLTCEGLPAPRRAIILADAP